MKKFLPLLALLALLPSTNQAQNLQFKVGGGLASHYSDAKAVGAFKIGIGYEIEFDQHWTFTPTLSVYAKGWKDKDQVVPNLDEDGEQMVDEDTGELLTSVRTRSASANYIEVPLLFSYYLRTAESHYVVFSAGPYLAVGISGKRKTHGDGEASESRKLYYDEKTFNLSGVNRFDAGIQAMVGYQFPSGFTLGIEADFGVLKFSDDGARNLAGLISLGYKL